MSSLTLAPVAALSLWLLISDPVTAAAVMERGDLLPVLGALAKIVGKAIAAMLALLLLSSPQALKPSGAIRI